MEGREWRGRKKKEREGKGREEKLTQGNGCDEEEWVGREGGVGTRKRWVMFAVRWWGWKGRGGESNQGREAGAKQTRPAQSLPPVCQLRAKAAHAGGGDLWAERRATPSHWQRTVNASFFTVHAVWEISVEICYIVAVSCAVWESRKKGL